APSAAGLKLRTQMSGQSQKWPVAGTEPLSPTFLRMMTSLVAPSVMAALTAASAAMRPNPYQRLENGPAYSGSVEARPLVSRQIPIRSVLAASMRTAVDRKRSRTWIQVRLGRAESSSAPTPAASGVAAEVPPNLLIALPGPPETIAP